MIQCVAAGDVVSNQSSAQAHKENISASDGA